MKDVLGTVSINMDDLILTNGIKAEAAGMQFSIDYPGHMVQDIKDTITDLREELAYLEENEDE